MTLLAFRNVCRACVEIGGYCLRYEACVVEHGSSRWWVSSIPEAVQELRRSVRLLPPRGCGSYVSDI